MNGFFKMFSVPEYDLSASQNIGVVVLSIIIKKDNHNKWLVDSTSIVVVVEGSLTVKN